MEAPAWILVIFLSVALFIFLVLGIVLIIALIGVTKEAKKIMLQGQNIAEKADDIADNVRDMTTVGGLVKYFTENYLEKAEKKKAKKSKKGE
jgi:biopolymer transport protein ExbB/TolQ